MGFIFEVIFEAIFLVLLKYPGALIRWLLYGGKRNLKELLDEKDPNINTNVSIMFICLLVLIVFTVKMVF